MQRRPGAWPPARSPLSHSSKDAEDSHLFDAPPELLCPITHAVFLDPVLSAAGHAYERAAVQQFLRHNDHDPMSRQPLPHKDLTPVWALKSRALEYREGAARTCLERACCPPPSADPVRYLRRAVELCVDAGFLPQGLTPEVVHYVSSHPSNAYDRLALLLLAQSLFDNGYKERAAAVYFHLLATDDDRVQQAEYLRRCLACWDSGASHASSTSALPAPAPRRPSSTELVAASRRGGGGSTAQAQAHVGELAYERLVALMDRRAPIGWMVEVAAEAGMGDEFVTRSVAARRARCVLLRRASRTHATSPLTPRDRTPCRLCETLLFPRMPPAGSSTDEGGALPWESEKQLLMTYTHVLTSSVKERQAALERRLEEVDKGRRGRRATAGGPVKGIDSSAGSRVYLVRRPRWVGSPAAVAAACLAAALAGDGTHPALRGAVRMLPMLALLPE
jgi:hypothetical protein